MILQHPLSRNLTGELSGSIGDLGTFLPYIIPAITIGGLDATGIFFTFGLMYIFSGCFYRIPVPVQPMKVAGAAVLVHHLSAGELAASGFIMGACLLFLGLTGLIERLALFTPHSVTMGIQGGLGISLAVLGINFIRTDLLLGLIVILTMLFLFRWDEFPVAIIAVAGGTLLSFVLHPEQVLPAISLGFHLPTFSLPAWGDFGRGFTLAFLPQLPLTLTNSILVTSALARELFPTHSNKVNEKNLCLTLGVGNLLAMPLGGFVMCHGSGGLAAHYRFGGRSGLTVVFTGVLLLCSAVFLGPSGVELLNIIPQAVLGGLLFYSGIDLLRGVGPINSGKDLYIFAIVLVLGVSLNPALAFIVGLFLYFLCERGWIKKF